MLKAKTKELSRRNTKESNEMRKKKIKQKQQADRVLCAPTMVAAMKYLMLSGRMKREKNAERILHVKNTIGQDRASLDAAT